MGRSAESRPRTRCGGGLAIAFTIKQGDRRPYFVVALQDDFDEPTQAAVDLTTATGAVFNMRLRAAPQTLVIQRGSATITSAATGEVTYAWGSADTATAGAYDAEVEITWGDGKAETFPSDGYWAVTIVDDLA